MAVNLKSPSFWVLLVAFLVATGGYFYAVVNNVERHNRTKLLYLVAFLIVTSVILSVSTRYQTGGAGMTTIDWVNFSLCIASIVIFVAIHTYWGDERLWVLALTIFVALGLASQLIVEDFAPSVGQI
jgi:hypothetical protein